MTEDMGLTPAEQYQIGTSYLANSEEEEEKAYLLHAENDLPPPTVCSGRHLRGGSRARQVLMAADGK